MCPALRHIYIIQKPKQHTHIKQTSRHRRQLRSSLFLLAAASCSLDAGFKWPPHSTIHESTARYRFLCISDLSSSIRAYVKTVTTVNAGAGAVAAVERRRTPHWAKITTIASITWWANHTATRSTRMTDLARLVIRQTWKGRALSSHTHRHINIYRQ